MTQNESIWYDLAAEFYKYIDPSWSALLYESVVANDAYKSAIIRIWQQNTDDPEVWHIRNTMIFKVDHVVCDSNLAIIPGHPTEYIELSDPDSFQHILNWMRSVEMTKEALHG